MTSTVGGWASRCLCGALSLDSATGSWERRKRGPQMGRRRPRGEVPLEKKREGRAEARERKGSQEESRSHPSRGGVAKDRTIGRETRPEYREQRVGAGGARPAEEAEKGRRGKSMGRASALAEGFVCSRDFPRVGDKPIALNCQAAPQRPRQYRLAPKEVVRGVPVWFRGVPRFGQPVDLQVANLYPSDPIRAPIPIRPSALAARSPGEELDELEEEEKRRVRAQKNRKKRQREMNKEPAPGAADLSPVNMQAADPTSLSSLGPHTAGRCCLRSLDTNLEAPTTTSPVPPNMSSPTSSLHSLASSTPLTRFKDVFGESLAEEEKALIHQMRYHKIGIVDASIKVGDLLLSMEMGALKYQLAATTTRQLLDGIKRRTSVKHKANGYGIVDLNFLFFSVSIDHASNCRRLAKVEWSERTFTTGDTLLHTSINNLASTWKTLSAKLQALPFENIEGAGMSNSPHLRCGELAQMAERSLSIHC
ncbi:hypothetical protein BDK51DRAFT_40954 [Blyttiomyces helicus]|uniref:Uncharacterized protein n=1 Tax=Blyttiomyces helicus TaxID=388810 RepID=A0A4P9WFY3_9FUNG|nr:hypothetical protein BDK51DRAFT_40954 [Blyttiomyces helicus]|eukprot:RKO89930.1 hypothetical protein BDK51DRAFT_40954 [Blyttiomyces helicus]